MKLLHLVTLALCALAVSSLPTDGDILPEQDFVESPQEQHEPLLATPKTTQTKTTGSVLASRADTDAVHLRKKIADLTQINRKTCFPNFETDLLCYYTYGGTKKGKTQNKNMQKCQQRCKAMSNCKAFQIYVKPRFNKEFYYCRLCHKTKTRKLKDYLKKKKHRSIFVKKQYGINCENKSKVGANKLPAAKSKVGANKPKVKTQGGGSKKKQGGSKKKQGGSKKKQGGSKKKQGGSKKKQGGSKKKPKDTEPKDTELRAATYGPRNQKGTVCEDYDCTTKSKKLCGYAQKKDRRRVVGRRTFRRCQKSCGLCSYTGKF